MERAALKKALNECEYKPSKLMLYARRWKEEWLPLLRATPYKEKYSNLTWRNEHFLDNGWTVGDENEEGHTLNQESYDLSRSGPMAEIAILRDMRREVMNGKVVEWKGKIKGKIPIFAIPKTINPKTGRTEKWRIIRDGTHAQKGTKSINDLTPDHKATMKLVTAWAIQSYLVIMFLLWGFGCQLGKTDLSGAFRQFYWAPGETEKLLYEINDMILGDLNLIWGSRGGGKNCQDWAEMITRITNLKQNGIHQLKEINSVIEEEDYRLYQNRYENLTPDIPDFETKGAIVNVWKWNQRDIRKWVEDEHMEDIDDIVDQIKTGRELIFSHKALAELKWDKEVIDRLKGCSFFRKLRCLKVSTKCCILSINKAYIDDFLMIFPPMKELAQRMFEQNCHFINETGMTEETKKRFGVNPKLVFLGVQYDAETMKMYITDEKKKSVSKLLSRGLGHGNISLDNYESLVGKLGDLAILVWPGKAFIRRMRERVMNMIAKYGRHKAVVVLSEWEKLDWIWWRNFLEESKPVSILRRFNPHKPDHFLSVDGATNGSEDGPRGWMPGVGCWYKGQWIAIKVPGDMIKGFYSRHKKRWIRCQIQHFEMMAVVVAFANLDLGTKKKYVLQTDNTHVESALKNKNSADEVLMNGVRWITQWARRNDVTFYIEYIHTKANTMADHASRFNYRGIEVDGARICRERGWTLWHHRENIVFPNLIKGEL